MKKDKFEETFIQLRENQITSLVVLPTDKFDIEQINRFARELRYNTSLESLELQNCNDHIIIFIADALKDNKGLKKLIVRFVYVPFDFSDNKISDKGTFHLAMAIKSNSTLNSLSLINGKITDDGAVYLADMLTNNNSLAHLYLNGNKMTDKGAQTLLETLDFSPVTHLHLSSNKISKAMLIRLSEKIKDQESRQNILMNKKMSNDHTLMNIAATIAFFPFAAPLGVFRAINARINRR